MFQYFGGFLNSLVFAEDADRSTGAGGASPPLHRLESAVFQREEGSVTSTAAKMLFPQNSTPRLRGRCPGSDYSSKLWQALHSGDTTVPSNNS